MTPSIQEKIDNVFKSMLESNEIISSQIGAVIKNTLDDENNFNAIVNLIDKILLTKKRGKKPYKRTTVCGYGRSGHFSSVFYNRLAYHRFPAQEARSGAVSRREVGVLVTGSGTTTVALNTTRAIKEEGGATFGITYQKYPNKDKHKKVRLISEVVGTSELDKGVGFAKFKDFEDRQNKIDQRRDYLIHLRLDTVKENKKLTPMGTLFELSVMYLFEVLFPVIMKLKKVDKAHRKNSITRRKKIIETLSNLKENRLSKINDILLNIVTKTLNVNKEPFKNALYALLDTFKSGRQILGNFAKGPSTKEIHLFSTQGGFQVLEAFNGRLRHLGAPSGSQGRTGNPTPRDILLALISNHRTDAVSNIKKNKAEEPSVITIIFAREDNKRYEMARNFLDSKNYQELDKQNDIHNSFIRVKAEKYDNLVGKHYFVRPFLVEMPVAILLDCIVSMLMSIAGISPAELASHHGSGGSKGRES